MRRLELYSRISMIPFIIIMQPEQFLLFDMRNLLR
jgi:hypothetical protein